MKTWKNFSAFMPNFGATNLRPDIKVQKAFYNNQRANTCKRLKQAENAKVYAGKNHICQIFL